MQCLYICNARVRVWEVWEVCSVCVTCVCVCVFGKRAERVCGVQRVCAVRVCGKCECNACNVCVCVMCVRV